MDKCQCCWPRHTVRYGSYLKGSPDADAKDTQGSQDDQGLHNPVLDGAGHLVHDDSAPILLGERGGDPVAVHDAGNEAVATALEWSNECSSQWLLYVLLSFSLSL